MPPDLSVSQVALVVIAIAVSIQSLLLVAAAWALLRAYKSAREQLERRLNAIEARMDAVADASRHMVGVVERCAGQVSTLLNYGERLTSGVASVLSPKAWLLGGAASRLVAGWGRRRRRAA